MITSSQRPTLLPDESIASCLARVDAWRAQGDWQPAGGGTEQPFQTRSGATLIYCYQPRSGRHAYLDCGTDLILTDDEAANLLGVH